eukprot:6155010-Amphidinium_carterae.1
MAPCPGKMQHPRLARLRGGPLLSAGGTSRPVSNLALDSTSLTFLPHAQAYNGALVEDVPAHAEGVCGACSIEVHTEDIGLACSIVSFETSQTQCA